MSLAVDVRMPLDLMTAMIFLNAAVGKMRNWLAFQGVVANYRVLPESLQQLTAFVLPPLETAVGVCLLTPWARPWGELAAAAALAVFGAAMALNLARGRAYIDCGCFQSTLRQTLRWRLVARNAVLALLLCGIATAKSDPWAGSVPATELASLLNGALGGIALFFVWQSLNALWSIVPITRPLPASPHPSSEE